MRISWNEIRARAARFADEWKGKGYERGETQTFYNEFFEVFGVPRKKVAIFEEPVKGLAENKRGFIDLFWKGMLLVEQKSAGGDLKDAKQQAFKYLPGIKKDKDLPRYILLCDFQSFELYDLEENRDWKFGLYDLPSKVQAFSFIFGGVQREFKDEDPVNIKASELMGELHDALKASGYVGHDLERFLVRLVFCLFADDTGIFTPKGILADYVRDRTQEDGSDLGPRLARLFQVLNDPETGRAKTLDEDLAAFPYVNGDLFAERLPMPDFTAYMRKLLLEACDFNWSLVSPAIFGALFQSVMDKKKRRAIGAHYTNEQNIMKVIGPLFLDDLKSEWAALRARRDQGRAKAMAVFQDKLASIKCFDPACGCGNFLVIAYRELREIENELIVELRRGRSDDLFADLFSKVDVNQFYGIEIEEFPARIAETALWMMDHIMNRRLSDALGLVKLRIPLRSAPTIINTDALETNWGTVLPPNECSYVLGNPPFIGQSFQTTQQREQMRKCFSEAGGKAGSLDYVTCWFLKASSYVQTGSARIAFVATNSISQGEQVAQLWPLLFEKLKIEIAFAHRTFAWGSEARGKANVHVVIIGMDKRGSEPGNKRLFEYPKLKGAPTETVVKRLSPYLIDSSQLANPHVVVRESRKPMTGMPRMRMGCKIVDGGNLILEGAEKGKFVKREPKAKPYVRPFVGSEEYINGGDRWIIYVDGVAPNIIRSMPTVMDRLAAVKKFRSRSKKAATRELAGSPARFEVSTIPTSPFLCVPEVSSELRDYVPIGYLVPPTIPSNLVQNILNVNPEHFSLITSRMHMVWLRYIGGRLESRYRYSIGLVYNPFPWPDVSTSTKSLLAKLGQTVLDVRAKYPKSTLADLYDATTMPPDLRKAHQVLDLAVDRLYRKERFTSDRARVEFLLTRYEALTAPALALAARKKRPRKSS